MSEAGYGLVMKFLDASESFCNGYEMGMLHMQMQVGESIEGRTVHAANLEQIEMLARSSIASEHGYTLEWEDTGVEGGLYLTAKPSGGQARSSATISCHSRWVGMTTPIKEGDTLTNAGHFERRTFWQWFTRQPRWLQVYVVTEVAAPSPEGGAVNRG